VERSPGNLAQLSHRFRRTIGQDTLKDQPGLEPRIPQFVEGPPAKTIGRLIVERDCHPAHVRIVITETCPGAGNAGNPRAPSQAGVAHDDIRQGAAVCPEVGGEVGAGSRQLSVEPIQNSLLRIVGREEAAGSRTAAHQLESIRLRLGASRFRIGRPFAFSPLAAALDLGERI
jgi:hypothetical protein